jgi:hypothetical protein
MRRESSTVEDLVQSHFIEVAGASVREDQVRAEEVLGYACQRC